MARVDSRLIVFLGPSLPRTQVKGACQVLPPCAQGDVLRALRLRPRAICLIDGVFEGSPSVWHKEILAALDAGVAVFGGASMGALRAAELAEYGTVGVGQIFRWYRDNVLNDDSEVALLHADKEHDFKPMTVPLVNIRFSAESALKAGVLKKAEARFLVKTASDIFYQERSWARLNRTLQAAWPKEIYVRWESFGKQDLKALDARACIETALQYVSMSPNMLPARATPQTSFLRRMQVGLAAEKKAEFSEEATGRVLLARWAKSMGIEVTASERDAAQREWLKSRGQKPSQREAFLQREFIDESLLLRMVEELALKRKLLKHSIRVLPDGPSFDEGAFFERLTRD